MRLVSWDGGFGRVEGDSVIRMGDDLVAYLRTGDAADDGPIPLDSVSLRAPVRRPEKVVCIGLNYRDHAAEQGAPLPEQPVLFCKFANSVIGPGQAIEIPPAAKKVDYEAELGVIVGRTAREVDASRALSYVAGYVCANDVTARDLQFESPQWTRGKAVDTFLPIGPHLVTADEVDDPQELAIRCRIGDEVLQDSSTANMVFGVAELVSFVSQTITLRPGDIIATGTPAGVGFVREPSRYLEAGEEVTIEIDGVGVLTNPVRRRP